MEQNRKQTIKIKTYKSKGDLEYTYSPLRNLFADVNNKVVKDFTTTNLNYSSENAVNIECQDAYDGSVNLILNDTIDSPRIINSAFTVQENDKYEKIVRNQNIATNYYTNDFVDSSTRLQKTLDEASGFLTVDLQQIGDNGVLKGGNYIFLIRYCDDDGNDTHVICESGIISIYKGDKSNDVSGTLQDEICNKSISLSFRNIDRAYSKIKVLYKRNFCDLTGVLNYEFKEIVKPYVISVDENQIMTITINGYESTIDTTYDAIIASRNIYNNARTLTQVQNTLFLGNVAEHVESQIDLQNLSYLIQVEAVKQNALYLAYDDFKSISTNEYYDASNIYYNLGYMPNELYRFGIVYVYDNDTTSSVYNLIGNELDFEIPNITDNYIQSIIENDFVIDFDMMQPFIDGCKNTKGVFIMPNENLVNSSDDRRLYPIGIKFSIRKEILEVLRKYGIKGYYFVRQKRIPNFIAQGYSVGISKYAHIPMLFDNDKYFTDGILYKNEEKLILQKNKITTTNASVQGLICVDAILNSSIQSLLDGSKFTLVKTHSYKIDGLDRIYYAKLNEIDKPTTIDCKLIYVPENSSSRIYNKYIFSTKAGSAEELTSIRNLEWDETEIDDERKKVDTNTVRGQYTPFIGVCPSDDYEYQDFQLDANSVYNIYLNYCESIEDWQNAIMIRIADKSEYTAISEKYSTLSDTASIIVFRGDCFTGLTSTKFQWNFLDYNTPLNNTIVKKQLDFDDTSYSEMSDKWSDLNVSDWNAVPIGYIFSYRYMSNYNLSVRSIDQLRTDEMALFGSYRSFYPHAAYTDSVAWKLPDSNLLNAGLSTTQTCLPHFEVELVPYVKHTFDNRIAFSEIQQQGGFQNGYRIFQGLSYQDIDSSYGAIVKLLPFGSNLFCVFEHGCGIVPVNEKALITTTTGQSIHMKGTGVLQSQVSVVSQDYGSIHEDSVIITPGGIYGVDVFAKKIWRFANNQFTIISDQYVQRFLNDNINDDNRDTWVGFKNIKTHYNNYKGDVMFTFYNDKKCWNLCYNERIGKFTTKYSWTPLLSDNIQNSFISFDKEPSTIYSLISFNSKTVKGLLLNSQHAFFNKQIDISVPVELIHTNTNSFKDIRIINITYPVLDGNNVVIEKIPSTEISYFYDNNEELVELTTQNNHLQIGFNIDNTWSIQINKNSEDFFTSWIKIDVVIDFGIEKVDQTICFALDPSTAKELTGNDRKLYEKTLVSKLYTHGFAGNHKELNYLDSNPNNQLKPTYWYDKQEPFEFEFVVNTPTGIQKIFNNLSIISNNAEPQSLEISLIGDSYDFNKANIYKSEHFVEPKFKDGVFDENQYNIDKQDLEFNNTEYSQDFVNMSGIQYETSIDFDPILNQYYLKVKDDCRNIKDSKYGRRLGNIEYKEDKWNLTLTPIYYKQKELKDGEIVESKINSTRIRDKWIKVRIKYTGEKLVVISAIQTLMTLSFA